MSNDDDIAKIEFTLNSPDEMSYGGRTEAYTNMVNGRNRTAHTVLLEKGIGEKSYYIIEAVPDTKAKTVYIVSAFIGKSGYKKETLQLTNAKDLGATAKTGSADVSQAKSTTPFYKSQERDSDDNTLSKGQQEHSNAFAKNKDVRYMGRDGASSKSFNEYAVRAALWDALDHEDGRGDNLILVSDMPQYVKKLTGISGDFYIQRNHAYENMKSEDEAKAEGRYDKNAHYHSIDIDKMTSAMMSINSPIMSIATKTKHGNPAIIIILDEYGSNDAPLYAVLSFYSNKGINGDFSRKPHVVLTIAERNYSEPDVGRSGYDDIIRNAIEDGRVIDFDAKKEMICQ